MTMHILLIEDSNLNQEESLATGLEAWGHSIFVAHTPPTAAAKTKALWPNLVILNHNNRSHEPATFQTAIDQTNLNIPCLVISEDLLPPASEQLNQRINQATAQQRDRFIRLSCLILDCHQNQVLAHEKTHSLTPKEFKLLRLFITHPNEVLSRKTIMQQVWETDYMGDTRTLDVHIRWLREKIEQAPSQPRHIITVRGIGYRFVTEPE